MSTVNASKRSALSRPSKYRRRFQQYVVLQLQLPRDAPFGSESFFCQLLIHNRVWEEEDGLFEQLNRNASHITIAVFNNAQRLHPIPHAHPDLAVVEAVNWSGHLDVLDGGTNHVRVALNARLHVEHVERDPAQGGKIWLVRATLLSGGISFLRASNDLSGPDITDTIWPGGGGEQLQGIFVSGSDLQIEVRRRVSSSGFPQFLVRRFRLLGVKRDEEGVVSEAIWEHTRARKVLSYFFPRRIAEIEQPDQRVAGQLGKFRARCRRLDPPIEVALGDVLKSLPAGSLADELDRERVPQEIKDALGVSGDGEVAILERGHEWQLDIQDRQFIIQLVSKENSRGVNAAWLDIYEAPTGDSTRTIARVSINEEEALEREEFLKTDLSLRIRTDSSPEAPRVAWRPQTLFVVETSSEDYSFTLVDTDVAEQLLRSGVTTDTSARAEVSFQWSTKASERTQRLPETELAGTSVAPNAAAQDLWFQARCAPGNKSPYPQAPAALVHISAAEPNGTPTRDDAAAARLSGPLLFQTGDADTNSRWRCQVVPAGSISRAVTTSSNRPRVQLELEGRLAELTAELKFHAPDVTVDSPTVAFYDVPLNDPQSAPNERRLHSPLVNQDGSLRFNCRAGDPPRPGTVRCVYDPGQQTFEVSRRPAGLSPTAVAAPQAATVLLPATRALVDPVSVTRGNLVALQTVAFPVYRFPSPGDANRLRVRVKEIRQVSSEPPKAQLDLEFLDTDANTIFARADLPTDGALKGFFAEFVGEGEEAGPAVVLRVLFVHQGLPSDTILTIDVKHVPGLDRLRTDDFEYRLSVGPTRLALPRDVNHGLIPLGIGKFRFAPTATNGPFPELAFVEKDVQGAESQSAFALHLWSERGPDPRFKDDSDNPQAAWLETGRVRLHHRNLVQEHAEFESSFEDRFPPEGPQVDPETGNTPSPLLPLQDFLRSVRDRYTEASGNLLQKGTNEEQKNARQLRNWLPKAELEDAGGNDARPVLQYADNPATVPEVELPAGPFDEQNLKLRKSTDDDLDRHWLDVDLRPEVIDVGKRPEVRIETTDPLQTATRRALDSSTPLLFEEHEVTALATANLPGLDDRTLVVVGGAGEVGAVYRYTADGELDASADFSGVTVLPLVDAALTENGRQVLGVVVASDGKAWRFVIKADLTFESIDEINRASHTAQAVAATPPGADPAFAILWQPESGDDKPVDVYQSSDWETPIQALVSSKTTAIAMDWTTKGNALLAIGFSTGGGELRDASNWETSVRTLNPLSGKHDLRSIAVVAGTYQRVATTGVFACNIKGQACHWFLTGGNAADATEWHLPGDVLSVSTGNVRNLESRREAEGAAAADLVAAGLRSGVTRVAAIRAAKRLAHVRSFDAASAPVALNTLPRLSPLDRVPRRVFRGMHNPTSVPNATAKFDWWIASDSGNVAGVPVAKGGLIVGLDTGDLSDATKVMVAPAPFGAFRGAHDASSNTNPSGSQSAGDWWVISAGGQLYSNSLDVLAGDLLVVLTHPPTDQSHVAVARRHQASSPIATGASSGKTQLADLRIGTEWVSPPTRDSSTYADALSVIRQAGAAAVNGAPGLKVFRPIAGNDIVSGLEVSAVKAAGDGATPSVDLTLKFVDSGGTEVAAAATSDANGKWSAAGIDLSSLGNGMVTLTVTEDAIPANKAWARFALNKGFSAQPPKLEQVPGAHAPDTVPRQTFVNPAAQRPRPGDIVVIHSDTQGEVGKGKVQRDGPDEQKGSFVITTKPLDPVTHKLTYTLEDPAGNVSVASEELVITIAAASPNNLVIDLPVRVGEVDHPDNVLNAGHTSSDGRRTVTLSGSGMNGQVVEVTFTHHGNGVSVPTVQDTVVDERWEVSTDIEPLGDGRITAAVVMGAQTAEAVLIVDSQPPVAKLPVQLDPTTNYDGGAVSLLNRFGGGAATFSLPPEAGGRGDTINLYVDDQQQDPVPVQGDGSAYLTIDLDAGDHRVTYQFVDTAGNQSKLSPACHIAGLIVDELSPTRDEEAEQPRYFSISTGGLKIVSDEPVADELDKANLTDIRIWADSFKVHREFKDSEDNLIHVEGAIDDLQFADDVFDPGRMLFFSAVRADQQRQLPPHELAPLDYLPRLGGVPIYVTKVTKCQLDYDPDSKSAAIRELVFTAVPVNPDEVAAGVDPADLTTTAGLVRRAASRNSSLNVRVRPGDVAPVTVDGKVDWLFSVNRQIAAPDPQPAIGGQLARLVSSSVSYDNAKNILSFVVDLDASRALVMGRLWKLEDPGAPLVVRGHGSFVRAATSGDPSPSAADSVAVWRQRGFTFRTDGVSGERLVDFVTYPANAADNQAVTVPIPADLATLSWDTAAKPDQQLPQMPGPGRYWIYGDSTGHGNRVLIADRTTGLAEESTSSLFELPEAGRDAQVTSTAIIEELPETTIGVGRADARIHFYTDPAFSPFDPTPQSLEDRRRAEWRSADIAAAPRILLTRSGSLRGRFDGLLDEANQPVMLTVPIEQTPPARGQRVVVEPGYGAGDWPSQLEVLHVATLDGPEPKTVILPGADWQPRFDEDESSIRFYQELDRVEGAKRVRAGHELTVTAPLALSAGERVRLVGRSSVETRFGTVDSAGASGPVVRGLSATPAVGTRIGKCIEVTGESSGALTLRLKSDGKGLNDGDLVLVEDKSGAKVRTCFAANADSTGMDVFVPDSLDAGDLGVTRLWRTVEPVSSVVGNKFAVVATIAAHGLAVVTRVHISELGSAPELTGDYFALPLADGANTQLALCQPVSSGTTSGTPVFVRPDGTEYEIDSVRGQAPLRIQFKAPDPLLKTGHHGKIRGIKEIAEDDVVFLEVVGDSGREFALYRAKEAPPQAPRQLFWDRVDRGPSRKITKVEGSAPTVVHSPLPVPKTGQLVRILAGSKHEGVFVARTRSANEWETWRPVDSLSAAFWSRLQGGDAERTDERQRPRLKISSPLRKTPAPIVMYDGKGNRVGKGKLLQRGPTELRSSCAILEELVNDQNSFAAAPAAWRSSQTIGVTVASDTLSLRFGPVPVEDVSGEPPGSTRRQSNPIERVAADQWSDHVVAVTVDGDDLMIWPVGTPGEVEPLASIDDIGTVSALATRNCGKRLSIATLVGKSIKVFQVWTSRNRLHAEEITAAAVDSGSTMLSDPPPQLVLTEDEQQLVVGLGGAENNADEEPQAVLKTWRLPISSAGPPLPNERPQRLWSTSTFPTAPVGFLAAGATAGSPHFLVEQGGTLRQWSPGRMIRIRSGHRNDLAPQASLPVDLGADVLPEHDIAARLTPARAVAVSLVDQHSRTARAHLRIVQGVTRCLTLSPTTADARRGRQGLVIWPSGDLADPRISTSLSDLSVRHSTANVTIHIGGENVTLNQFHEVRLAVISSTLARPTAARHESLTLAVEGEIENGKLTLLLEGTVEEELGSSNRKPFTGLLSLSDEENKLIRQAMIRCDVAPQADGSLVLRVRNDLFWRILAERPAVVSQKPDIVLPRAGVDASFAYSVAPIQLAEGIQFVELKLRRDSSGMHLETVPKDEADVPLIPDLEPSRLRSPDRIGEETTRLAHRRRGGLVLRPSIPEDKFRAFDQLDSPSRQRARDKEPENPGCLIGLFSWLFGRRAQNPEPAPAPTVPASTQALDPFDLLEPVVEHDGPLFRLRPEGCLVSFDFAAVMGERWMTDGLIVLSASGPQADQQGDLLPFVASLESRTLELDSAGRVERQRYRALIAESGAAGIAAHFRVPDAGAGEQLPADFAFVDSPFFDNPGIRQSGAAGSDDLLDANGEQLFEPLVAGLPAFDKSEALDPSKSAVAVDFRLLPPIAWESEVGFAVEHRYIVADLPFDPQADVCCLAHRHYRLLRHSSSLPASESFDGQETPVLHVSDVPAFRQPATLRFSSAGNWVRATTQNNGDSPPPSSVFFPRRLDWELAADKPGAMFQTLVQARTTTHSGVSRREPSIDFAYREPQFVRLGGCVTADVEWQEKGKDDKFTVVAEDARDRLDATLVWREIVGAVDIAPLAANGTTAWLSLAPEASGIALTEPPLQLIISFNSEVISVRQADAAVPAYRIQSQIDEQFGLAARNVVQPASTFLFTHLLFDKLTETRTLYDKRAPKASWPALRLISTVVGSESNLAALEGAADAALDGARVELTGFESTDFEQTDRRLIMLDDNPKRYLVGDEVVNLTPEKTDSADPYPIPGTELANINGSGDIYRITATRSNRPLHFQLELKVGSALPPSGTIVETQTTGTGTVSEFGNLRTGGNIPAGGKLILCQLAEGEYALFAPARFAGAEVDPTGAAHPLETRAQPYLEASPRVAEVQVRAERPPNAAMDSTWGAGLTIEDSTGFKPGEYIRLAESDHLEADGVFCLTQYKDVMGGDVSSRLALCRPSVSIGAGTATAGGEIARSKPSARTAALTNVEGKSPIRVTFVEGTESELANWDGASVIVRGVDGNRSAEGTWVLGNRSYDEDQQKVSFDLLEPAISPPLSELARPSTGPALTFVAVGSRVVELEEAFRPTGSRGLATLDANAIPQWEPTDRPLLQIYWAGAADHLAAGEFAFKTRRGGDMTQLYEQAKQIKFLANSQLSPKLIFVVNVLAEGETEDDQKPVFHRTMLFGDSAPVFDAQPTLEPANGTVEQFVLQIPDNEEQLSVQLPRNVPSTGAATLYVVKSLPSGVAVFNTIDVAWPRPTP